MELIIKNPEQNKKLIFKEEIITEMLGLLDQEKNIGFLENLRE